MSRPLLDPRRTGALLVASAVAANVAFIGLGGVFEYPQVLQQPAATVLRRFADSGWQVAGLFALLALGSAAMGPISVGLARLGGGPRTARAVVVAGVAAAVVQAVGLLRWPLLVPGLAATATDPSSSPGAVRAAEHRFDLLGTVLGTVVGEGLGYVCTAAFTVLVVAALRRRWSLPRVPTALALMSAPMILCGLLVPFGVEVADMVNFAGYVLWSVWVIVLGVRLVRTGTPGGPVTTGAPAPAGTPATPAPHR